MCVCLCVGGELVTETCEAYEHRLRLGHSNLLSASCVYGFFVCFFDCLFCHVCFLERMGALTWDLALAITGAHVWDV